MKTKKIIKKIIFGTPLHQLWWRYVYLKQFRKEEKLTYDKLCRIGDTNPKKTIRKMRRVCLFHLWQADEYLSYHYEWLSRKGRKQYVLNWEKTEFCKKVNPESCWTLFNDKYQTYVHFQSFFKRNAFLIDFMDEVTDIRLLEDHFRLYDKAIVKPVFGGSGKGVKIFNVNDFSDIKTFYQNLKKQFRKCIVEEVINQDPQMASFHPQSVNTLRMPAMRIKNEIHFFHPGMRIGRGDSIVDNGGAGGILAAIDVETGIIKAAATEDGTDFVSHPDTNLPIIGFRIPQWEEAKTLTRELMDNIPEGNYISWDLALSDKGWLMIEGNVEGQFFGRQLPIHRGVRNDFNKIRKSMGIK